MSDNQTHVVHDENKRICYHGLPNTTQPLVNTARAFLEALVEGRALRNLCCVCVRWQVPFFVDRASGAAVVAEPAPGVPAATAVSAAVSAALGSQLLLPLTELLTAPPEQLPAIVASLAPGSSNSSYGGAHPLLCMYARTHARSRSRTCAGVHTALLGCIYRLPWVLSTPSSDRMQGKLTICRGRDHM